MATAEATEGNRTPSPPGTYSDSAAMGGNGSEVEVPSPVPASVSSTTSSEPSQIQHGSNHTASAAYAVPNPFATVAPAASGWGSQAYETGAPPSYPHPHHQPPPAHHHHPGPIPMVVSAPQPAPAPAPYPSTWQRENSCPNFSIGTTEPNSPDSGSGRGAKGSVRRKSYAAKSSTSSSGTVDDGAGGVGDTVNSRRQKRLERNRESARLSRRRRKQYLEVLEDRVTQLSSELDQGRRAHASQAVTITLHKRREILELAEKTDEEKVRLLEYGLGRASPEMMLVATFKYQQLKSFSLPAQSKFVLWLTLQNDQYFRGGRAASERLSAARIGERMLNSGTDRVPPAASMWPLFCNEVGLSYDQEERVRQFQRTLLQTHDSWLQRHSARAADLAMASCHDSTQALSLRLGQRERSMLGILSPEQKVKFLCWAENNRDKLQRVMQAKVTKHMANTQNRFVDERFKIDKKQHVAANLYVLNSRFQKVMQLIPRAAPLVTGATLKKLSRRPSFESLGRAPEKPGEGGDCLSREHSFASSGSLKRSASVLSMDGERPALLQISPDDAEETCKPTVEKVLGHLREIIPPSPPPQYSVPPAAPAPPPAPQPTPQPAPQPQQAAPQVAPPPPPAPHYHHPVHVQHQPHHQHHQPPPHHLQHPHHPPPPHHPAPHPHHHPHYHQPPAHPHQPPPHPHPHYHQPPAHPPQPPPHQAHPHHQPPHQAHSHQVQPKQPPPPPPPQQTVELRIPSPAHVTSVAPYQPTSQPQYSAPPHHQVISHGPVPMSIVSSQPAASQPPPTKVSGHKKQSSFIPPYLNVVPEEMFPNDGTADEFLMSLVDEDWAIGEGIDMDTTT